MSGDIYIESCLAVHNCVRRHLHWKPHSGAQVCQGTFTPVNISGRSLGGVGDSAFTLERLGMDASCAWFNSAVGLSMACFLLHVVCPCLEHRARVWNYIVHRGLVQSNNAVKLLTEVFEVCSDCRCTCSSPHTCHHHHSQSRWRVMWSLCECLLALYVCLYSGSHTGYM